MCSHFCLQLFFLNLIIVFSRCEWVEIPQFASKKSYIGVTPFTPYIYDKTTVFTSTTTSAPYETIATPIFNPTSSDEVFKKSITKLPDSLMKNIFSTTPVSATKRTTSHPLARNATNKPNKKLKNPPKLLRPKNQKKNATTTTTTTTTEKSTYKPKVNQVLLDEHEYEEAIYDDDEEYEDDRGLPDDDESAELSGDDEYYEDDTEYGGEYSEEDIGTKKGGGDGFTYAGFLPYLQNIQSTLIRNSHKSPQEKVSFLVEIKNRLLYAIQQKIASLWSSRAKSRKARSTRGDYPASWEKGDGGMGFPSNEGALLTLGFLTFAVFLIKCVLKLVQAMKQKGGHGGGYHPNVVVVVATTAAPAAMMGKRSIGDAEIAEMMNKIDSYKYKQK